MKTDTRLEQLKGWIKSELNWQNTTIEVASADASFRRYFRVYYNDISYIAMDAPPTKEDILPFIDITQRLLATGVHAPKIIAQSIELGFLMLEDLGSTPYQDKLNDKPDSLYFDAMQALIKIQTADTTGLENYDKKHLDDEMQLMPEWFLKTHLGIELSTSQQQIIKSCFEQLTKNIETQANGFVHRDYHSRNLMIIEENNPAIIDYQDAVFGPITYDLVSLLRDCYIHWPNSRVEHWALQYRDMAASTGLLDKIDDKEFIRWFDLMGLQRHIKVLGIFCRLWHRDGKKHYLDDLPLTLSYVLSVGEKHTETQALVELFHSLDITSKIGTVDIKE